VVENKEAKLELKVGQMTMEIDFSRNSCALSRSNRMATVAADRT
jgi:hypothetical protein